MTTTLSPKWTDAEIAAYASRYGLSLPEPLMTRLRELADKVSLTGQNIARQPSKDCEPALSFTVHIE